MAKSFEKVGIDNYPNLYYDLCVTDPREASLVFLSAIGVDVAIKRASKDINKINYVYFSGNRINYSTRGNKFIVNTKRESHSTLTHMIAYRKDSVEELQDNDSRILCYLFLKNDDTKSLYDCLYDKLYKNSSIPIMKEWISYIADDLFSKSKLYELNSYSYHDNKKIYAYKLDITSSYLLNLVSNGLATKVLNINGCNAKSELMDFTDGLDSYLNVFGDILANRIQQNFKPQFDPQKDKYSEYINHFDDFCYYNGIELYEAQKATIQAAVNNLNENNVTFVVGEMGVGKTIIGSGISYCHYGKKSGASNIIMCPSHLTNKWKREIEKSVPNAEAVIISSISDIKKLDAKIRNKHKRHSLYLILSKESAKFSYEKRPCAIWSKHLNTFVCPNCGKPLKKRIRDQFSNDFIYANFEKTDFLKPMSYNLVCDNDIRKFDRDEGTYKIVKCNTDLWAPFNKNETNLKWIKLGSSGWVLKEHIDDLNYYYSSKSSLTRQERALFSKIIDVKNLLDNNEEIKGIKAPRKFSLAKYLKDRYKGVFDYFICDEMHELKGGDSLQGQAMADIFTASKNFIGLTGTLLNGYASGLFYILYRTLPNVMRKEGFKYNSESEFIREFGVVEKNSSFSFNDGSRGRRISTSSDKQLPGVSPLLFTKFLLENAVFISLSDMDGGLPKYEEIPIAINMDESLDNAYKDLERDLRSLFDFSGRGAKMMGNLLQTLSVYPDMPYDQPDVIDPDTGETLVAPPVLNKGLRNKERALLDLVKEKVNSGEKVLIYYEWTNRTDIASKITKMFKDSNINSVVLTSSVKSQDREEWINNKLEEGIDVLICNPKLVETGLDLLAFTNIIFYQVGYNIFTLRQASRRSWRLSQTKDIKVYFMYYEETIQARALTLMASKLKASMAIEGKFSEEGLRAMSNNDNLLTQIANSVVEGIKDTVEINTFTSVNASERSHVVDHERVPLSYLLIHEPINYNLGFTEAPSKFKPSSDKKTLLSILDGSICLANL